VSGELRGVVEGGGGGGRGGDVAAEMEAAAREFCLRWRIELEYLLVRTRGGELWKGRRREVMRERLVLTLRRRGFGVKVVRRWMKRVVVTGVTT
jgi:hypothetical protein